MRTILVIFVVIFGVFAVWLLFILRSEPMLTPFVEWVTQSWGGVVIGAVLVIEVPLIAYIWSKLGKKTDTAEYIAHQNTLLEILHKADNLSIYGDRQTSLLDWWKLSENHDLRIDKGHAHKIDDVITIELDLECEPLWPFLQKHLLDTPLLKVLEQWKSAMKRDLEARRLLFDAITKRVAELSEIPVVFDNYESIDVSRYPWVNAIGNFLLKIEEEKAKGSHVTWDYIAMIYDEVFCKLVGIKNFPKAFGDFKRGQGSIYYDNPTKILIYCNTEEQGDRAVNLLLELQNQLTQLPEAQIAKSERLNALNQADIWKKEITIITSFPKKNKCERCP